MHRCPHCGEPGLSRIRKAFLGPAVPATCRRCGGKIGVGYVVTFAMVLPWMAALYVLWIPELWPVAIPLWQRIVVSAVWLVALPVVWDRFVPLQARATPDRRDV
jgi:hypothetical protein